MIRSAIAGLSLGAAALVGAGVAAADDPPNCTAADQSGVLAGVTTATSAYLFTHPDVNAFITGLKNLPKDEIRAELRAYGDANPQVRDELRAIRQPIVDFRNRCGGGDNVGLSES
ncbi:hypothetical protein MBRU_04070 [Mycolicibacterium brumae DSM 44177]|nr:hypothetical protein MBRU_04070 [Mycolicibacterium brumae DSM 44177]